MQNAKCEMRNAGTTKTALARRHQYKEPQKKATKGRTKIPKPVSGPPAVVDRLNWFSHVSMPVANEPCVFGQRRRREPKRVCLVNRTGFMSLSLQCQSSHIGIGIDIVAQPVPIQLDVRGWNANRGQCCRCPLPHLAAERSMLPTRSHENSLVA